MLFFVLLMYTFSNVKAAISEEIITITNADGNTSSEVLADRNVIVYVEDTEEGWIEAAASYLGLDYDGYSASEYVTEENSKYYRTVDGVLYSKDMRVLYLYPAMKEGWYFQVPATVEIIEECAFQGCSQLASVTFEKGSMLKTIGGRVYAYNKDNCRYGAFGAFTGCPITSIEIPASVETIEVAAFQDCSQLASVTFEKGSKLKTIGGKSVYGGVISGSKVYYYYYGGFASTALQLFVIDAETPPQCNNYAFYGVNSSAVLKVPSKSVIKYKMASEWKNFSSILGLDE